MYRLVFVSHEYFVKRMNTNSVLTVFLFVWMSAEGTGVTHNVYETGQRGQTGSCLSDDHRRSQGVHWVHVQPQGWAEKIVSAPQAEEESKF